MLPENDNLINDIEFITLPSINFKLHDDFRVFGKINELDSVKQAIFFILNTERYKYEIYDYKYGIEFSDLLGKTKNYCIAEIPRRIEDALMQDDRITNVYNFNFSYNNGNLLIEFYVDTIYGNLQFKREVVF